MEGGRKGGEWRKRKKGYVECYKHTKHDLLQQK